MGMPGLKVFGRSRKLPVALDFDVKVNHDGFLQL